MSNCCHVSQVVSAEHVGFMWHNNSSLVIDYKEIIPSASMNVCYMPCITSVAEGFLSEKNPCLHGADIWMGGERPGNEIRKKK